MAIRAIFGHYGYFQYKHDIDLYSLKEHSKTKSGKLEQRVKHVLAMKLVTDRESSWFRYVPGILVIFVLVYCEGPFRTVSPDRPMKAHLWLCVVGRCYWKFLAATNKHV